MDVKWNKNGNWLLTASRDHLIKIFDIRNMGQEVQTFRGHKKEACCKCGVLCRLHLMAAQFQVSLGIQFTSHCLHRVARMARYSSGQSGK